MYEYDVFICHSSKDKPMIESLIKDLKKERITYWVDAEQIDFGDSITEKIAEGLEASKYVIPCVSKNLKNSKWTRAEFGSMLNAEFNGNPKKVIPLLLDECEDSDIHPLLRDKKRVTYSNKTEFNEFIKFLKKLQNEQKEVEASLVLKNEGICKQKEEEMNNQENKEFERKKFAIFETHKDFISPSTGIELVLIPAGEFIMGSRIKEVQNYKLLKSFAKYLVGKESVIKEVPVHKVTIKNPFYIGKYPITQKQWTAVMNNNPSSFKGDDKPVESISWNDIQSFIKKLNKMENTDKYRLPSEAEWEYACRAGIQTEYFFGEEESELDKYAWYDQNSSSETNPIGRKKSNPWGLYDMYGNVRECVQDRWHDTYIGAPSDGSAWEGIIGNCSLCQVCRGGCWNSDAEGCRSASRTFLYHGTHPNWLGFRLVRKL